MTPGTIAIIVLILAAIGYVLGRRRALQAANREGVKLHSLPGYYGESVALFTAVPALFLMAAWLFVQPIVIESSISAKIPDSVVPEGGAKSLVMVDVRRISEGLGLIIAEGNVSESDLDNMRADLTNVRSRLAEVGVALGSDVAPGVLEAAKSYRESMTASPHRFATWSSSSSLLPSPSGPGHALPPKCAPATSRRPLSRRF
jgi:phosphate transport system permease protein